MRKLALPLLLVAAVSVLSIAIAHAATLQFIYSEDAGPTTTVNSSASTDALLNVTTPNFTIRSLTGSTQPDLFGGQILSGTSIDVSGTGGGPTNSHTLHLTINGIGITGISGLNALLSSFDTAQLTPFWQVTATTDINNTILSTQLFVGTGSSDIPSLFNLSDPFNASIHWDITNNGVVGGANVGTVLSVAAVPGPLVGAGLPGLLGALGLWGLNFYRRRKAVA